MRRLCLLVPLRIALIALGAFCVFLPDFYPDWESASQEYATDWRAELELLPDPEAAKSAHRQVATRHFPNGEWAFGVCRDSMGIPDGGVVVVKDSTGTVRIFFGQGSLGGTLADVLQDAKSLADFYRHETWTILQFKEYEIP